MAASPWALHPDVLDAGVAQLERHLAAAGGDVNELEQRLRARPHAAAVRPSAGPTTPDLVVQDGVATIPIKGMLVREVSFFGLLCGSETAYSSIADQLAKAVADPGVTDIVLEIDSPGGEVAGCPELADKIFAARSAKPITAFADGMIASAAYWLGSAASAVYCTKTCVVGSIGVIAMLTDVSRKLANDGIVREAIVSGRYKAGGNVGLPIDRETREQVQRLVDNFGAMFTSDITKFRGFTSAEMSAAGEARIFVGSEAETVGLVDGVTDYPALRDRIMSRRQARMDIKTVAELREKFPQLSAQIATEAKEETLAELAGKEPTTVAQLEAAHPTLCKEISEKASTGPAASEQQLESARAAERERCKTIALASFDGQAPIVAELIGKGVEASAAVVALKASRQGTLAASDTAVGSPAPAVKPVGLDTARGLTREQYKAEWEKSAELQAKYFPELGGADAYASHMVGLDQGRVRYITRNAEAAAN